MNIAIEALNLFLMSLPAGCEFQVCSFGSYHTWLRENINTIEYNDSNMKKEKQTISSYYANYGTTEIYRPLNELFELKKSEKSAENWNIFLLTDGCVDDK